jgi:hypothetical protein
LPPRAFLPASFAGLRGIGAILTTPPGIHARSRPSVATHSATISPISRARSSSLGGSGRSSILSSIRNQIAGEGDAIMRDRDGTKQDVLANQERMLRLAERDHSITAKVINAETGIPLPTVQSWRRANSPVAMALADFVLVCRVIPDSLTSLCLEPSAKHVGTNGDDEGDLDAVAPHAGEFAHEYQKARHPASPGGVAIVPQEAATLHDIRREMVAKARAA